MPFGLPIVAIRPRRLDAILRAKIGQEDQTLGVRSSDRIRHDRYPDRTVYSVRRTDDAPPPAVVVVAPWPPPATGRNAAPNRRPTNPEQLVREQPELVVALMSGILAATAGLRPTGNPVVDTVVVAAAAAGATWLAAAAPWWTLLAAAALAAALAPTWPLIVIALVALGVAALVGTRRHSQPVLRSMSFLLTLMVLARLDDGGTQGLSTLLACSVSAVVIAFALRRRSSWLRRRAWIALAAVIAATVVASVGLILGVVAARASLQAGNREAHAGLSALNQGDLAAAASAFRQAEGAFSAADDDLSAPWTQLARFVPIVAQHREAAVALASGAADVMAEAVDALSQIDPDSIRVIDGRIDLDAVRALSKPFDQLTASIADLSTVVEQARSPWLVGPVETRLERIDAEIDDNLIKLDNARLAVQVAPAMLGGEGTRIYFVAFTNPAEARGLGGYMGNFAEVTIDDGNLSVTRFGRTLDLMTGGAAPEQRRITGPDEFIDRWGGFGFVDPADGTTGIEMWGNVTMPPDLPMVADVISQLYPQSGGAELDGVFVMAPEAVAALMNYTGPVELPAPEPGGTPVSIGAGDLARFITQDQYVAFGDPAANSNLRADAVETIARTTLDRLLSGALPPPAVLGRDFGPLASAGKLLAWSPVPDEELLFERVRLAGAFPALNGADGVAVTIDNAGGNKLDAYLQVRTRLDTTFDPRTGITSGTATVSLTNTLDRAQAVGTEGAPPLPDYVVGNPYDLASGTNIARVVVYTGLQPAATSLDGRSVEPTYERGFGGWYATVVFVEIPAGTSRTVRLDLSGSLADPLADIVVREQPMTLPQYYEITRR